MDELSVDEMTLDDLTCVHLIPPRSRLRLVLLTRVGSVASLSGTVELNFAATRGDTTCKVMISPMTKCHSGEMIFLQM